MKISAILFRRVGDSLMATPALRSIKKTYPDARLSVVVEPGVERVFQHNPWIDEITIARRVTVPALMGLLKAGGRPDIVIDFLSDPRSAWACCLSRSPVRVGFAKSLRRALYTQTAELQDPRHPIYSARHKLRLAATLGAHLDNDLTDFFLSAADREWADAEWRKRDWINSVNVAAFFVHSRREYKRWPVKRFAEVAQFVRDKLGWTPLLLATPGDEESVETALSHGGFRYEDVLTLADLGQLGAVLEKCGILIGNDGGPKHIAVAVNTPTLTVFGKESPEYWTPPHSDIHRAVVPPHGRGIAEVAVADVVRTLEERFMPATR